MTRDRLKRLATQQGFTLNGAARFLDIDGRTVRRWVNDGDEAPRSVVMLLAVMEHYGIAPETASTLGGYEFDG